jgi:hypothetical protein
VTESGVLYVGYTYGRESEPREIQAFYYNTETNELESEATIPELYFNDVCAGDSEIILSSGTQESIAIRMQDGEIVAGDTDLSCRKASSVPTECTAGGEIFRQLLPNSDQELMMCLSGNETTMHIVNRDGIITNLGSTAGAMGGTGRYVVSPMVKTGQYLFHHNQSAINSQVYIVDVNTNIVAPVNLPDLSNARPPRGFGAGKFGLELKHFASGYLADGEGGQVYLLHNQSTTLLADNVYGSVVVLRGGCAATMIQRDDKVTVLLKFNLCL